MQIQNPLSSILLHSWSTFAIESAVCYDPGGFYSCFARCSRHEACHKGDGKMFKFAGKVEENGQNYRLQVQVAGECNGPDRKMRRGLSGLACPGSM